MQKIPATLSLGALALALLAGGAPAQGIPKLLPFQRTLDILVVDSSADGIWRCSDFNQDGDLNDFGEVTTFYDDTIGSYALSNPDCIAMDASSTVYVGDSSVDIILALRDANGNGRADDPNEHWIFFDSANNASGVMMTSIQGITVDGAGVVWAAVANTLAGGQDTLMRFQDLNGDGDAGDAGEATIYARLGPVPQSTGDSIPTKIRVGASGEMYYTDNGVSGIIPKGIYRLHDDVVPNGNVNDPGEISPFFIFSPAPGNFFAWTLAAGHDGTFYVGDNGNERVWKVKDLNGDQQINNGTAEEVLYYQNPASSNMWGLDIREDGALLVAESQSPDRLLLHIDLDGSGVIDQPNETIEIYNDTVSPHDIPNPRGCIFMRGPHLIAQPNPATIGGPINFTLFYQPNGTATLFLAAAATSVPLPPLGTLELDPLTMTAIWNLQLDASGLGVAPLSVPPDPILRGFTVHSQAFVLDPYRPYLSNLESVIIQ